MKRFYTDVAIGADGGILLDGRAAKTPARAPLALPTHALADAVAHEWRAQGDEINPRTMPLTGLANAAIDRVAPDPAAFAENLAAYGEGDLLFYRADHPDALVDRQSEAWDPLLDWARARYDVHFALTTGINHQPQPPVTISRLNDAVSARESFALAPLNPLVTISGSLIIALALAEGAVALDRAWDAALLDELWQEEHWGADELASRARANRRQDFEAAARFLALIDPPLPPR